jgi:protein-disulfide isomerase-like protein with CxxC motif
MSAQLYFVYDSHCPWSYATTSLVNAIKQSFSDIEINIWHCGHYNGSDSAGQQQVETVAKQSTAIFGQQYIRYANGAQNATLTANLMAWLSNKQPDKALDVLNALQHAHFVQGNALGCKSDFDSIVEQFKLSPPAKVFKEQLSKDAEFVISDVGELQELIGTTAFPALLLLVGDKAVLLNHFLYLETPTAIVEAVKLELAE